MPPSEVSARCWVIALLLLLGSIVQTVHAKQPKLEHLPSIETTCPSRTINYITATLPQQCLRTDWSSGQTSTKASDEKISTTAESQSASVLPHTQTTTSSTTGESATASVPIDASATAQVEPDNEQDPLSDNANFLSFEEWKAQMLQKTGQSPEHVAGAKIHQRKEPRVGGINNALDGYGEDGEIEIDFGGFPVPDVSAEAIPPASSSSNTPKSASADGEKDKQQKIRKEAGTTSKHRFNYASFDCAATVLKTNPGSKGSTSILSENKDSYMINACSIQNKFIIVELCDDINIDTIVLGNFEFFSSTFRTFRVSVSDRYPAKADKWENIGTFEARNNRGIQPFVVENMRTWGRYLRIEFLTHYGAEYYCPLSLLRVHGKTMMEDWKADVKASQGEDDDEEEAEDIGSEKITAKPSESSNPATVTQISTTTIVDIAMPTTDLSFYYDDKCPRVSLPGPLVEQTELVSSSCQSERKFCHMAKVSRLAYTSVIHPDVRQSIIANMPNWSGNIKSTTDKSMGTSASATIPIGTKQVNSTSSVSTKTTQKSKASSTAVDTKVTQKASEHSGTAHGPGETRSASSTKSAHHAVASVAPQDSFFRSVHKRLQQLEANSTLSLQYIEEQSRILREAFTKVEKRQLSKTSTFLETLNSTVLNELRQFRLQYDQIWQSTVLELSAQREQSQKEVTALSQRLSLLADEMLWQRRLAIFQFGLIMLCLALVVFSRNAAGASTFDVPILQNMVPKQRLSRYLTFDSPPTTPSQRISRSERLGRSVTSLTSPSNIGASDDETLNRSVSNDGPYQLPTPGSEIDEPRLINDLDSSPEPDLALRRAQSVPNLSKESDDLLDDDILEDDPSHEPVFHDLDDDEEARKYANT